VIESNRRSFVLGLATIASAANAEPVSEKPNEIKSRISNDASIATDQNYWNFVRDLYKVSNTPINLENGYWG